MADSVLIPNIRRDFHNIRPDNSCMRCHASSTPNLQPENTWDEANFDAGLLILGDPKDARIRKEEGIVAWFTRDKTVSVVQEPASGNQIIQFKGRLPNKGYFSGALEIPLHKGAAAKYDYLEFEISGAGTIQTQFYLDGSGDGVRKYPNEGWRVKNDDVIIYHDYSSSSKEWKKVKIPLDNLEGKGAKEQILLIQFNALSYINENNVLRPLSSVDLLIKNVRLVRGGELVG